MSSRPELGNCLGLGDHGPVHDVREVALQAAERLEARLPVGHAPRYVLLSARIGPCLDNGHGVDRAVELTVATAVEPMPTRLPRGGGDRRGATHRGNCRGGVTAPRVAG